MRLRSGFTFVELMVVIAMVAMLVVLLLPAVQAAREAARRTQCRSNLSQIALALQNYHQSHNVLPPGSANPTGPIRSVPEEFHFGWYTTLLPELESHPVYVALDRTMSIYDARNTPARQVVIPVLTCPSDQAAVISARGDDAPIALSSYAGIHHPTEAPIDTTNHGVLFLNSRVRFADVRDGVSHTMFVGEILRSSQDLGWASGTRATLRNTGAGLNTTPPIQMPGVNPGANDPGIYVGGLSSAHKGWVTVAFGDGSVRVLSEKISLGLLHQFGDRADGDYAAVP